MHRLPLAAIVAVLAAAPLLAQKKDAPASLAALTVVNQLAYAPDGCFVLVDYRTAKGYPDQSNAMLGVFDADTGKLRLNLDKPPRGCDRIAVSADGKRAAAVAFGLREAKVWDTVTGKPVDTQKLPEWGGSIVNASFLKFAADGKTLWTVWQEQPLEIAVGGKNKLHKGTLPVFSPEHLAFDPDATSLLVVKNLQGSPAADLYAADLLKEGEPTKVRLDGHVEALARSADGKTLALSYLRGTAESSRMELWDAATMKVRDKLPADGRKGFHHYRVLAFAPDDKAMAGAPVFDPRGTTVLDLLDATGKVTSSIEGVNYALSLTFSPDGKTPAVVTSDYKLLLVDPATGKAKK